MTKASSMLDPGLMLADRYTLISRIARGGMGEVWSAQDTVLDRRVAVKVLLPNLAGDPGFAARFRAEARAMAALSDPGIVEVYDYGQTGELVYLVMQFIDGESLFALLRRDGTLTAERTMGLLAQAAGAIHAAHRQGIVHRDVKPGNLMLRPDGRLVLTDFGIARIVAGDHLTAVGEIIGTVSYLAPEQVTGDPISPATDVYALGVVAYELLAGRRPFVDDNPLEVAMQHVQDVPPPLPPSVPEPVAALVLRALAKDPADRWPSAAALAHAAKAAQATLRSETAPSGPASVFATPSGARSPSARSPSARSPSAPSTNGLSTSAAGSAAAPAGQPDAAGQPDLAGRGRRRPLLAVATLATVALLGVGYLATQGRDGDSGAAPATSRTPLSAVTSTPSTQAGAGTPSPQASGGAASPSATPDESLVPTASVEPSMPPSSSGATPQPAATTRAVPQLVGMTETAALAELQRLGLAADVTPRIDPDNCGVTSQNPVAGTTVQAGSTVEIVVSRQYAICIGAGEG
jgi:eukaryotic-like serine/threonine-protein kinase